MRFLTNVPGGKKLFESKKDKIKSGLNAACVANFFKDCMEKLQNNSTSLEALASETFAFPVEQEEQVPQWAWELQKDVDELLSRFDVTEEEETEVYPVQYAISVRRQVTSKHHVIRESVAVVVEKDMMGTAAPPRGFLRIRSSLRSRTTVTKNDYMTAKSTDRSS